MSEEENAPKKVARKRVVKKGVRGTRAPRKAAPAAFPEDEETFELASPPAQASADEQSQEIATEEVPHSEEPRSDRRRSGGKKSGQKKSHEDEPNEDSEEEVGTIEVVDEVSERPRREERSDSSEGSSSQRERDDSEGEDGDDRRDSSRRRGRNRRGGQNREREEGSSGKPRAIDAKEAAEKAWEIYQGELEEEGVSLVDPRRAREVARRCLELAAVFCEERDRFLDRS